MVLGSRPGLGTYGESAPWTTPLEKKYVETRRRRRRESGLAQLEQRQRQRRPRTQAQRRWRRVHVGAWAQAQRRMGGACTLAGEERTKRQLRHRCARYVGGSDAAQPLAHGSQSTQPPAQLRTYFASHEWRRFTSVP
eukprot:gene18384-biopygen2411